jgi:hypothetical protein
VRRKAAIVTPRRLSKRVPAEKQLPMKMSPMIKVAGPRFFSPKDEEMFFSWLGSIASVRRVEGVGYDLEIAFVGKRIPQRDLREILSIFHRYGLDKSVLKGFDSPRLQWFRDPKAYWHAEIFKRELA